MALPTSPLNPRVRRYMVHDVAHRFDCSVERDGLAIRIGVILTIAEDVSTLRTLTGSWVDRLHARSANASKRNHH